MIKILVPTDLTLGSLISLKKILDHEPQDMLDITMVYGAHLPSSTADLLFYSKTKHIASLCTNDFIRGKSIMEQTFSDRINSIQIDIFTGSTNKAFHHFIKAKKISRIYLPEYSNSLNINRKKGFDLAPFISNTSIEILEMNCAPIKIMANQNIVSKLLGF